MIMRVVWGRTKPGAWKDYERGYQDIVVMKTRGVKGLRSRWLVQDLDDQNAGLAVSIWDSMADLEAYEKSSLYGEILKLFHDGFEDQYWIKHCEVRVVETLQPK